MTRQELFDKAVRGLRSQHWEACTDEFETCIYADDVGRHCAWGWIDETSWPYKSADDTVSVLRARGVGLAAQLSDADLEWALELQKAHDHESHLHMEQRFR